MLVVLVSDLEVNSGKICGCKRACITVSFDTTFDQVSG